MRIALVVHQILPYHVGGTEVYTWTLARALVALGHEVHVFYPLESLSDDRQSEREDVHLWEAATPPMPPRSSPIQAFWRTFRNRTVEISFERFMTAVQPDVVHFQHLQNVSVRLIQMASNSARLLTLHDYWYFCANSQLIRSDGALCEGFSMACADCAISRMETPVPGILRPLFALPLAYRNLVIRRALKSIDRFVAPSEFVRQQYISQGISPIRIITLANGLSPERLIPSPERLPDPPGHPLFGYLGSLASAKGVHILIKAFNALPEETGLVIYGNPEVSPDYVNYLHEMADHHGIRFAGPLPTDRIGDALRQLDYLVVPSLWHETLGMVMDEAHAVGVPVIASRVGALQRITDHISGRLFDMGNVAALRNIMEELVDEPNLRGQYVQHLPHVPTIDEQAQVLVALYGELIRAQS